MTQSISSLASYSHNSQFTSTSKCVGVATSCLLLSASLAILGTFSLLAAKGSLPNSLSFFKHLSVIRSEGAITLLAASTLPTGLVVFYIFVIAKFQPSKHAFFNAIKLGNSLQVSNYLKKGIGVNESYFGQTPLSVAVKSKHPQIVKLLCDNGADCAGSLSDGITPIHLAATNLEILRLLLEKSPNSDVNCRTDKGFTPLHFAVISQNKETVDFLLSHKANADARRADGLTPFHLSLMHGYQNIDIFESLLSSADIELPDNKGLKPLHLAVDSMNRPAVKKLLTKNASPHSTDNQQNTPLHLATDLRIVKSLLKKSANVNAANKSLETCLHAIVKNPAIVDEDERYKICALLKEKKANLDVRDENRKVAASYASDKKLKQLLSPTPPTKEYSSPKKNTFAAKLVNHFKRS